MAGRFPSIAKRLCRSTAPSHATIFQACLPSCLSHSSFWTPEGCDSLD